MVLIVRLSSVYLYVNIVLVISEELSLLGGSGFLPTPRRQHDFFSNWLR